MKKYGALLIAVVLSTTLQAEMGIQDLDVSMSQSQCFEGAFKVFAEMGVEETQIVNLDNVFSVSVKNDHYFIVCRADKGVIFVGEQQVQYSQASSFMKAINKVFTE